MSTRRARRPTASTSARALARDHLTRAILASARPSSARSAPPRCPSGPSRATWAWRRRRSTATSQPGRPAHRAARGVLRRAGRGGRGRRRRRRTATTSPAAGPPSPTRSGGWAWRTRGTTPCSTARPCPATSRRRRRSGPATRVTRVLLVAAGRRGRRTASAPPGRAAPTRAPAFHAARRRGPRRSPARPCPTTCCCAGLDRLVGPGRRRSPSSCSGTSTTRWATGGLVRRAGRAAATRFAHRRPAA